MDLSFCFVKQRSSQHHVREMEGCWMQKNGPLCKYQCQPDICHDFIELLGTAFVKIVQLSPRILGPKRALTLNPLADLSSGQLYFLKLPKMARSAKGSLFLVRSGCAWLFQACLNYPGLVTLSAPINIKSSATVLTQFRYY